jgi:hypothetical protein
VERLGVLADLYLARLMRTQDPTPTYEQYKEVLPRRPTFARDQFVQKIFTQNAILVPLLELIARGALFTPPPSHRTTAPQCFQFRTHSTAHATRMSPHTPRHTTHAHDTQSRRFCTGVWR